jgi:hypothetical protein
MNFLKRAKTLFRDVLTKDEYKQLKLKTFIDHNKRKINDGVIDKKKVMFITDSEELMKKTFPLDAYYKIPIEKIEFKIFKDFLIKDDDSTVRILNSMNQIDLKYINIIQKLSDYLNNEFIVGLYNEIAPISFSNNIDKLYLVIAPKIDEEQEETLNKKMFMKK